MCSLVRCAFLTTEKLMLSCDCDYGESVSDKYLEAEIYELQAAISKEQP